MKKKNKVIDNKQKKKLIITSIFMLFLVVAASFAYYEMNSTESITSVFTSNLGETGGVSLTGPTPNLHIKLSNKDMHYTKEGTSYFATDDSNKNYDTEAIPRTIAKIEAVDTNPTYTYYCKFKLAIDVRDSKNNKFKTGDAILHLSGHYTADLDLSNYETPIDIEYFLDQDNPSKEIKAVLEVKNTTNNQNYAEGMELEVDIYNSNLVCDHEKVELTNTEWTYAYTGNYQEFTVPESGNYKIELWGASGYDIGSYKGGLASYVSGVSYLNKNQKLYVYVGQKNSTATYNGGGEGGHGGYGGGGGGATDIRLVSGNWDNSDGLKSRIMVAAGGASAEQRGAGYGEGNGGAGGGLEGYIGERVNFSNYGITEWTPPTQTKPGTIIYNGTKYSGSFGSARINTTSHAGGGSGYYGGVGLAHGSGSGGSSYISGHTGCIAIESASSLNPRKGSGGAQCEDGTSDYTCSLHYSGHMFTDTQMIDGKGYNWTTEKGEQVRMPNPSGGYYNLGEGHTGNGYAKITYVGIDYGTNIVIALDEGKGTLTGDKKLRRKIGHEIGELPIPTNEVAMFLGWYTKDGELVDENTIVEEKHQKLYARFGNEFAYTGNEQVFIAPKSGTYKIELWGAQGGSAKIDEDKLHGGYGGYTAGNISLNKGDKLYLYIGEMGHDYLTINNNDGGWNGGGNIHYPYTSNDGQNTCTGGGATDIRIVNGEWNNDKSLKSRIMVAGAGGGASNNSLSAIDSAWHSDGGSAGGLTGNIRITTGTSASSYYGNGGTQLAGGTAINYANRTGGSAGGFGYGGYGAYADEGSGGGSGYYGGGGTNVDGGGGGGSSYISGHNGCVAIESSESLTPRKGTNNATCTNGTTDIECSKHYSGYVFTDTVMIDGNGYNWTTVKGSQVQMPKPEGGYYDLGKGHTGNGYARITFIE